MFDSRRLENFAQAVLIFGSIVSVILLIIGVKAFFDKETEKYFLIAISVVLFVSSYGTSIVLCAIEDLVEQSQYRTDLMKDMLNKMQ